jgi:hypothetical protein
MHGRILTLLLAVALGGCSTGETGDSDSGDVPHLCRTNEECDDTIPCTVDTCAAGNRCSHEPVDAICDPGARCVVGSGCIVGACTTATAATDCDDTIACTVDSCGVGNICDHTAVDALCGALERCDPAGGGCVPSGECLVAGDCPDTVSCTVDDCTVDHACVHLANDALCAADEFCEASYGCFESRPCAAVTDCVGTVANFCDGEARCDPEFGCRPPLAPRDCNDGLDCTIDTCNRDLGRCDYAPDCSRPECLAANPSCLWNGCFDLDQTISLSCALGMVHYNFSRVCFTYNDLVLEVDPYPRGSLPSALQMVPGPTGMDFDAQVVFSGGCNEYYGLAGAFSDADHFAATWTASYVGDYTCSLCPAQTIPVIGTRAP